MVSCNGAKLDPLGGENDWLRLCAGRVTVLKGEVMTVDFGLVLKPGDGEGDALSKGLLRHRALPEPVVDMPSFSRRNVLRFNSRNVRFSVET